MGQLFHKNFSDALTGVNGFDSVATSNATIEQSAGAGLNGTTGGATVTRTLNSPVAYGLITQDFLGKTNLRTAWYTDLSSLTIGTDNHSTCLYRFLGADGTTNVSVLLVILLLGVLNLQHRAYRDDATFASSDVVLGNPEWIELQIIRASGLGVLDGESHLYLGGGSYDPLGELVSSHTGLSNYTVFENSKHRLGMVNFTTNTSVAGSLIVDEWTMQDSDEPILFGVSSSIFPRNTYRRRRNI